MELYETLGFTFLCAVIAIIWFPLLGMRPKKTRRIHNWLVQREKNKKRKKKKEAQTEPVIGASLNWDK